MDCPCRARSEHSVDQGRSEHLVVDMTCFAEGSLQQADNHLTVGTLLPSDVDKHCLVGMVEVDNLEIGPEIRTGF